MYAYMKGEIVDITDDNLVLECNNIGYNIRIPLSVAQRLPGVGATIKYILIRVCGRMHFIYLAFCQKMIWKSIRN